MGTPSDQALVRSAGSGSAQRAVAATGRTASNTSTTAASPWGTFGEACSVQVHTEAPVRGQWMTGPPQKSSRCAGVARTDSGGELQATAAVPVNTRTRRYVSQRVIDPIVACQSVTIVARM